MWPKPKQMNRWTHRHSLVLLAFSQIILFTTFGTMLTVQTFQTRAEAKPLQFKIYFLSTSLGSEQRQQHLYLKLHCGMVTLISSASPSCLSLHYHPFTIRPNQSLLVDVPCHQTTDWFEACTLQVVKLTMLGCFLEFSAEIKSFSSEGIPSNYILNKESFDSHSAMTVQSDSTCPVLVSVVFFEMGLFCFPSHIQNARLYFISPFLVNGLLFMFPF